MFEEKVRVVRLVFDLVQSELGQLLMGAAAPAQELEASCRITYRQR